MFPDLNLDNISASIDASTNESTNLGKVFMFEFIDGKTIVVLDDNNRPKECETVEEKVQMYAQILLRTEFEKFKVYKDTGFGMTYFEYKGYRSLPKGFVKSEMKREINENLTKLNVVNRVENFNVSFFMTTITCSFNIILNDESVITSGGEI